MLNSALLKTLGLCIGTTLWWSLAYADEHWTEVAKLHDGNSLEVSRIVEFKRGKSDLTSFFHFYPTTYSIQFEHPSLHTPIRWRGIDDVLPIAIDFVGDAPFLVVYGNLAGVLYSNPTLYGCPDVPYAYLKYDLQIRKWIPIASKDAPDVLRHTNLSADWHSHWMRNGRLTAEEIARNNALVERKGSGNYFNQVIPRNSSEWQYTFKERDHTTRYENDCRPRLEKPKDAVFPRDNGTLTAPSTAVVLQIIEKKEFDPPWVVDENSPEWSKRVWDADRYKRCQAFIRPANQGDSQLQSWVTFSENTKEIKNTSRRPEFCDEKTLWFFDTYSSAPSDDRMVIAKVRPEGDVLYRINFMKPDHFGFIASPTFIQQNGYLYFEWWDATTGMSRKVKKITKYRIKEPADTLPASPISPVP